MSISPYRNGFTLIELSIVIVIIGLIVAGVVGGQKLVRQAQLRSVITEVDTYKIAYHTFFLQYGGVPGDIENATDYWSGTANGNGNKAIHWSTETLRTWQQLSLAKLIPGSYTGAKIGSHGKLGANVPASKLSPVS
jgi:prepilin-type N-terminal cleavage/methylation domain-containing protein